MKNFTKICLCICLAFVCLSIICLGAGAALGSGFKEVRRMVDNGELDVGDLHIGKWWFFWGPDPSDAKAARTQSGVVSEKFAADEVQELTIDIKYAEVFVVDSSSDKIEITVDAPKRYRYQCGLKDGEAELVDETPHKIWNNGLLADEKVNVTIAIPEGKKFEEVTFCTNAGKIEITHAVWAEEVEFEINAGELVVDRVTAGGEFVAKVDAGRLEVEQFEAETLEANCGLGEMVLGGRVLEGLSADCGMGRIELALAGREEDYDYTISCGMGAVRINGENYTALGTDREIDNGTGNEIELECGMGEIEITLEEEL